MNDEYREWQDSVEDYLSWESQGRLPGGGGNWAQSSEWEGISKARAGKEAFLSSVDNTGDKESKPHGMHREQRDILFT